MLPGPTVTISANPATINAESSSTLTVAATIATQVTVTGSDGSSYTLATTGGTQSVAPKTTTTYTATATGAGGSVSATATVTVTPASLQSINHVVFLLQENHTFDNYFGMLNPYRKANSLNIGDDGVDYEVDGIDDKLATITNENDEGTSFQLFKFKSTCIEDESSDWLASYGDVSRYDFTTTRPIRMDGFVHDAEGYAKSCSTSGTCSGSFPDLTGKIAMGYYDQDFLNYYYYMASQFAISDRWFSPVSSKSVDNRIAMFTGGTTQGIVKDPGNDHLPPLDIPHHFPGTRSGQSLVEDLLHRYPGSVRGWTNLQRHSPPRPTRRLTSPTSPMPNSSSRETQAGPPALLHCSHPASLAIHPTRSASIQPTSLRSRVTSAT